MGRLRTHGRNWSIAVVLALAGLALWWYPASHRPVPPDKLIFAIPKPSTSASLWVAAARDFYRQEGLDVTILPFDFGKPAFEAMLEGKADVAGVATTPAVLASFARRDFVILGTTTFNDNEHKIIARADRGIRGFQDLRGKTIGLARGTTAEFFLGDVLARHGMTAGAVTIRNIPAAEAPSRLKAGDVDAISAFEPYAGTAAELLAGNGHVLALPGIYRSALYLTARREFAASRGPQLEKLLRAIGRAEEYMRSHPEEVGAIMSKVWSMPPEQAKAVVAETRPELSLRQAMLSILEDEARWALQQRLAEGKEIPNYLDFIDAGPLKNVSPGAVTVIQ